MGIEQENEISDYDYINQIYIKNSISDIVDFNEDIEGNDSLIFNNNKNKTIIITLIEDNTFNGIVSSIFIIGNRVF